MQTYSIISNIRYIYGLAFKARTKMKFYLIFNFISSLLIPLTTSIASSLVVNALINNDSITTYIFVILGFALALFIFEAINVFSFQKYNWESTFVRVNDFWVNISSKVLKLDYDEVEPKSKQKELNKAFEALDSNWIGIEGMMKETSVVFINIVGMIIYGVIVAIYIPIILLVLITMSIINMLLAKRADVLLNKNREKMNDAFYERYYLANEISKPDNGKDIRLYGLESWLDKLFVKITKKRIKYEAPIFRNNLFLKLSNTVFLAMRDFIAYSILVVMVINKTIDVSLFIFLIGMVAGFSGWLNAFTDAYFRLKMDSSQVSAYRNYLKKENKFNHGKGIDIKSLSFPLSIEFKNVSFSYPDSDKMIIDNLSFKIEPGEKIALVGQNGAGKTTIVKLLSGLYRPTSGKILVNGYDVNEFNIDEYMQLQSVLFQDSEPLAFTVLENVSCKTKESTDIDKVKEVIRLAGLDEKINSLPNKENTYISQVFDLSGIKFSGGETQKLMLARTLYKNAPLLILDEPTAALDPLSEEKMYLTYEKFSEGNTSIFISHRLATTQFCDRVLLLENGKIKEEGSHEELIALNQTYRRMFDIQAKYYRKDDSDEQ
ncbi:MAG: ABC transporter ATP-binding protein [Acholeplasma sp.]|nr:ABC transporter ATP-binding protein [Acholeplasma sp.]